MSPFQQWFLDLSSVLSACFTTSPLSATCQQWTSIISNLAVAIAAILGIIGLWQWRAELLGKTKFEVARKMTLLALQFRDEYGRARNPWTEPREWLDRKRAEDEKTNESTVLNEYF